VAQYKTLKVSPEVFERLKRGKDDGQSWSHYLDELNDSAQKLDELEDTRR